MACLVMRHHGTAEVMALDHVTSVGRHPDNDLQLLDRQASKFHCVITRRERDFALSDLSSQNGTLLNHEPVDGERILHDGDLITVGAVQLCFLERDVSALSDEQLERFAEKLPVAVIRPPGLPEPGDVDGEHTADLIAENRRLFQFEAACRAVLRCRDVPTLMQVLLIAAEEVGGAGHSRIKLKHASGATTEQVRGVRPETEPPSEERAWPPKSCVLRIHRKAQRVTTELAIPIAGRGGVDGALFVMRTGQMNHLEHKLLRVVCDVASAVLASLEAK